MEYSKDISALLGNQKPHSYHVIEDPKSVISVISPLLPLWKSLCFCFFFKKTAICSFSFLRKGRNRLV